MDFEAMYQPIKAKQVTNTQRVADVASSQSTVYTIFKALAKALGANE